MLVRPRIPANASRGFEAMVCWMGEAPLEKNRTYVLSHTTRETPAFVDEIVYRLNVENQRRQPADTLTLNDIGRISIRTANPVFLDIYEQNRATGSFLLIDALTDLVAACGMVTRLYETRSDDEPTPVVGRRGLVVWLTGLSGAGKSTLSSHLRTDLEARNVPVVQLDGDALREGLSSDLGFSDEGEKREHPTHSRDRQTTRQSGNGRYLLAHLSASRAASPSRPNRGGRPSPRCISNAPWNKLRPATQRGYISGAAKGEIAQFTGLTSRYEPPEHPR